MTKKIKVSIMGGTGYAAAELIKRLLVHPHVELLRIASIDNIGKKVGDVHKNFGDRLSYVFQDLPAAEVVKDCDLVFLTMPHKVTFQKVAELMPFGVSMIDFSGDHRLRDMNSYEKFYETKHTHPENVEKFVYGLPELNRDKIKTAKYIANPGCFPTGTTLSLLPLAKNGLLNNQKVRLVAPTGSSGSGVKPSEGTHHPIRCLNLKSYKPLSHQHQPEMEQTLLDAGAKNVSLDFIPISAPLSRGMLTNIILDLPAHISEKDIEQMYRDYFRSHPFVRLTGTKNLPEVVAIAGTNFVEIGWVLREERNGSKSFAVISAFDNLVKGAAGQAIQNMNIMYGFEETMGIDDFGSWP
ncbi:MAG: N-acetyl-gamma-glutamyl-phosphate reductase [Oligoflexia bacterium]|nr:N-acetyl-gamma-glutamyl-phosphate reductase [Oligoflexia bacterium]